SEKTTFYFLIFIICLSWFYYFYSHYSNTQTIKLEINDELAKLNARANFTIPEINDNIDTAAPKNNIQYLKDPFVYTVIEKPKSSDSQRQTVKILQPTAFNISNIILTGIVDIKKMRYAIINDNIVKEGDNILGANIIKILNDRVVLKYEDKLYEILLKKSGDK
ncbi:MAG TPA: hypothetical protein PLJ38_01840, partial [bacterium]|nr:hypothetical protein [bacterium]